jgi:soluble lytic murein transglycosylase-like protein
VGCFQLNYRWHGAAFDTLDQMLSPDDNADYAAQFLRQLYRESGSWRAAAGLYHSRTPHLKARYLARFDTMLAAVPTLKSRPETPPLAGQAGGLRWVSFDDPNRGLLRRATPLFGAAR